MKRILTVVFLASLLLVSEESLQRREQKLAAEGAFIRALLALRAALRG